MLCPTSYLLLEFAYTKNATLCQAKLILQMQIRKSGHFRKEGSAREIDKNEEKEGEKMEWNEKSDKPRFIKMAAMNALE